MKKSMTISATLFAAALALTGCSAGTGAADSSMPGMNHGSSDMPATAAPLDTVTNNAADTMFVQGMIPHHSQAVEMSDIILQKQDIDPQVTELANKIKAAQAPGNRHHDRVAEDVERTRTDGRRARYDRHDEPERPGQAQGRTGN
ncbi:DUF305 domain-containing protein [Arthrobacter sp. PAMC25284]|uniref:DUF305 domain-containing protein n=1 Tax=Arthrobacter sp. PAMC25284 TaxID=2861279 RepID=UPI00280B15C1|nr:DUF305 domain-containing protein [Arthrobacter sp. PAMC25284]